jgi:hypothetical protein
VARTREAIAGHLLIGAQTQFATAQRWFNWQVVFWGALASLGARSFLDAVIYFVRTQNLPKEWSWQLAFYGGMRQILLGGIAAVGGFCLRMLKSQIAIAQLNAHRTRVARSMPGLLEMAPEADRLAVLQSLVQVIIGVKESILSDSNPESLLKATETLETLLKAVR